MNDLSSAVIVGGLQLSPEAAAIVLVPAICMTAWVCLQGWRHRKDNP